MNANSYFNNQVGAPRGFTNSNQWAAAIGGPIKKDKAFFFINYEGLRVIIPVRGTAYGPSPAYQAAILGAPNGGYEPYTRLTATLPTTASPAKPDSIRTFSAITTTRPALLPVPRIPTIPTPGSGMDSPPTLLTNGC